MLSGYGIDCRIRGCQVEWAAAELYRHLRSLSRPLLSNSSHPKFTCNASVRHVKRHLNSYLVEVMTVSVSCSVVQWSSMDTRRLGRCYLGDVYDEAGSAEDRKEPFDHITQRSSIPNTKINNSTSDQSSPRCSQITTSRPYEQDHNRCLANDTGVPLCDSSILEFN